MSPASQADVSPGLALVEDHYGVGDTINLEAATGTVEATASPQAPGTGETASPGAPGSEPG